MDDLAQSAASHQPGHKHAVSAAAPATNSPPGGLQPDGNKTHSFFFPPLRAGTRPAPTSPPLVLVTLYPLTLFCPVLFTQGKFLHFPGRRFGQGPDKFNGLGSLEVGHVVPTKPDQLLLAGVLAWLEHH